MAALQIPAQAQVAYAAGAADVVVLVALKNVTTGDTLDLGDTGLRVLSVINRAVVLGVTQFVAIAATWTGTVITLPTGLANDAGYILAWGSGT